MEEYSDVNIKKLIKQFPKVGDTLGEYNIECMTCPKGNCRLKDIVEAENLSMNDEIDLMGKISDVLTGETNNGNSEK